MGRTKVPAWREGRTIRPSAGASSSAPPAPSSAPPEFGADFRAVAAENPRFFVPPTSFDSRFFFSEETFVAYNIFFSHAKLIGPYRFDMKKMIACDLPELLKAQGWLGAVGLMNDYSSTIVRTFYANLVAVKNKVGGDIAEITSRICGKDIRVNPALLCKILGVPNEGLCKFAIGAISDDYSVENQWRRVAPDSIPPKPIDINKLDPLCFLLFHLVSKVILPRIGCLSQVPGMEVWVMYHLLEKNPLNLGYLVLNHMGENKFPKFPKPGKIVHLPYPHLIMRILEENGIKIPWCDEFSDSHLTYDEAHVRQCLKLEVNGEGKLAYHKSKSAGKSFVVARDLHWTEGDLNDDDDFDIHSDELQGGSEDVSMDEDENEDKDDSNDEDEDATFADYGTLTAKIEDLTSTVQVLQSTVARLQLSMAKDREKQKAYFDKKFQALMDHLPPPPPQ